MAEPFALSTRRRPLIPVLAMAVRSLDLPRIPD